MVGYLQNVCMSVVDDWMAAEQDGSRRAFLCSGNFPRDKRAGKGQRKKGGGWGGVGRTPGGEDEQKEASVAENNEE